MFNYIHETIVNDASSIKAITEGSDKGFVLKRGGKYIINNIFNKKIYVAKPVAGAHAKATITWEKPATENLLRITIFLSTPSTEFAEFAMPNWHEFGKPIVVETAGGTENAVRDALRLSQADDHKLFTVSDSGLTLETVEDFIDFAEITVTEFTPAKNGEDEVVVKTTSVKPTQQAASEFGTAKWIRENLRFPSGPNMRYTPLYADEAPVAGATYIQYSFQYEVKRAAPGGLSGVNQVVTGLSTQVIYVKSDIKSAFETALGTDVDLEYIDLSKVDSDEAKYIKTSKPGTAEPDFNGE